jgi:hypothetical protein
MCASGVKCCVKHFKDGNRDIADLPPRLDQELPPQNEIEER